LLVVVLDQVEIVLEQLVAEAVLVVIEQALVSECLTHQLQLQLAVVEQVILME
jgi:hypothetical protein